MISNKMVNFTQKLNELRKAKGLTQDELADKFGVGKLTVSRWETGKNTPEVATIIELSKFFNFNLLAHFPVEGVTVQDDYDNQVRILVALKKQLDRMEVGQRQLIDKLLG